MQTVALLDIPIFELMKLWGELTEAYHGVNGYGGNVAEIYAYRFQPYSPVAHQSMSGEMGKRAAEAMAITTNHKLIQLCALFENTYNCLVYINDHPLGNWPLDYPFEHRVHVLIDKRKR